jgi:RNA polymerase sigma-70 factor (ECF subfamily)
MRPTDRQIEALVHEHYSFIWRLLRRFGLSAADAEDAAQQVFMIAARKAEYIIEERARSFLYATAIRVASNQRRGMRRRRDVPHEFDGGPAATALDPEAHLELTRSRSLLDELLAKLPGDLQRVLILAEVEQLELPQIAELERIPRGTAASRLRRARQRFSELVQGAEERNPFRGTP